MKANRKSSGLLTGARPSARGAISGATHAMAGVMRDVLPAQSVEFWDAHDLAEMHEPQARVEVFGSSIVGESGVSDGIVARASGGEGPFFAPGALGGGPALRMVAGSEMSTQRRRYKRDGKMNLFMLLKHPKSFTMFDAAEGSYHGNTLRVSRSTIQQRTSSMWGGSTHIERPFPHKKEPYLLRIENDDDAWRAWQGKKLVFEGVGEGASSSFGLSFPTPRSNTLDLGFYLAVAGGVTEAEWDALRQWAGARWNAPGLPSDGNGDGQGAAGDGSLLWWLLGGAAALGGGVYLLSGEDSGGSKSTKTNNKQQSK